MSQPFLLCLLYSSFFSGLHIGEETCPPSIKALHLLLGAWTSTVSWLCMGVRPQAVVAASLRVTSMSSMPASLASFTYLGAPYLASPVEGLAPAGSFPESPSDSCEVGSDGCNDSLSASSSSASPSLLLSLPLSEDLSLLENLSSSVSSS